MSRFTSSLGYTQSNDLSVISGLIDNLSVVLNENRAAGNELLAIADTLDTDDDDETDSESVSAAAAAANAAAVSSLLARENSKLQVQVANQRRKNLALARLLHLTQLSLDKCVSGLRELVHTHTQSSLKIHQDYIDKIHEEQRISIEMELENAEIESQIFAISKMLRQTIRSSTVAYLKQDDDENNLKRNEKPSKKEVPTIKKKVSQRFPPLPENKLGGIHEIQRTITSPEGDITKTPDYIMGLIQTLSEMNSDRNVKKVLMETL